MNKSLHHKLSFGLKNIMAKRSASEIEEIEEVEVTFVSETSEAKRTKIKHAYDVARSEIEEILILLNTTTKKVKMLRSELKKEREMVSSQTIKQKTKDVLMMTSVHLKTKKISSAVEVFYKI